MDTLLNFIFLGLLLFGKLGITALAKQKSSSPTSNDYVQLGALFKSKTSLSFKIRAGLWVWYFSFLLHF